MNFSNNSTTAKYDQFRRLCVDFGSEFHIVVRFPSDGFLLNHKILFAFSITITILTMLLNSAMILTYWRSSQLKKSVSYFLIMMLALSDTLVGLSSGFFAFHIISEITGNALCSILCQTPLFVLLGFSLTTLMMLNLDRYMGIVNPLIHKTNWSKKRILKYGASHCLLWLTLCGVRFVSKKASRYFLAIHITGYCSLIIYIYVRIYYTAVNKSLQSQPGGRTKPHDPENETPPVQKTVSRAERRKHLKETKLAISCLMVVACFFLCYVPSLVSLALKVGGFLKYAVELWAVLFIYTNAVLDSLIFVWRDRNLRIEIKKVFWGSFR